MNTGDKRQQRYAAAIVLSAGLALCTANIVRYHARAWDDAFISFRFAQHLATGEGLVWNVHGERVEGFTSMLHVALLAIAARAGLDLETFALGLSVACTLATAAVLLWLLRRPERSLPLAAALPVALYLADDATAIHATSRLETPLFLLMLALGLAAAWRLLNAPRASTAIALAATSVLTILCRPEGALYCGVIYVALLIGGSLPEFRDLKALRRYVLMSGGLALGLIVAYEAANYSYFGYLLPNPFYVKSNRLSWSGVTEVKSYLEHVGWRFGVPMLVFIVTSRPTMASLRKSVWPIVLMIVLAAVGLGYYSTIVHETGGAHRFSFPTIVYLSLALGYVAWAIDDEERPPQRAVQGLAWAGAMIWMMALQPSFSLRPLPRGEFNDYHWRIAEALRRTHLGDHATVLTDAAGVIPYVSGFNHIDRVGLTDNFLSGRIPHRPAEREAYMWASSPQVYIGYEPPASAGCNAPDVDKIMRTPYVARILLTRPLLTIEDRIFLQDSALLHQRMRELRDHWDWIGEIDWPGWSLWHLKSFAYVRKDASPSLRAAVSTLVARHPAEVVLDNVPSTP